MKMLDRFNQANILLLMILVHWFLQLLQKRIIYAEQDEAYRNHSIRVTFIIRFFSDLNDRSEHKLIEAP